MKKLLLQKPVLAWALYDWANSAFATTIMAGFFPIFYSSLSKDLSLADSQFWFNVTLALSGILVAIAAPVLGAIADSGGGRKKFLASFALLGIAMSAGLAWVHAGMWWVGLLLYGLGKIGFAGANVFYDTMLMDVADEEDVDVVSGYGYALGYLGGGLLFAFNVLMVLKPSLFGLADASVAVSVSFLSVALWWGLFSIPLLMLKMPPANKATGNVLFGDAVKKVCNELKTTFKHIRKYRVLLMFLLACWLYIDGVETIIKTAIFFGSRVLELPKESLITALLLTQFIAFPSALAFGWFGKRYGPRPGILIRLAVYVAVILYAWRWPQTGTDFYLLAAAIGLVQGSVQSLSRSLYPRLVLPSSAAAFFGFYNNELKTTFKYIRKYRVLLMFLLAYWLYIDGVGTIIKTAVFFGSRVLELPQESLITALLLTQFIAFPSALAFGWFGKRYGPRPGILIGLAVYVAVILYAWRWLHTGADFYLLATAIGLVQGGVQSLSRSLYSRLVPPSNAATFFGFYNMVGKFASILGPVLLTVSVLIIPGATERDSILSLLLLFIIGGFLITRLDLEAGIKVAQED